VNIADVFSQQSQQRPDHTALIEASGSLSFADLEKRTAQTAALFRQSGLSAGDAVLVFVPMSVELYIALIALFRLNAVAMFLDPSAGRDHIERCCKLYPPQGFIGTPKAHLLRFITRSLRKIPHQFVTSGWMPGATALSKSTQMKPLSEIENADVDTSALVTFTSGSTGQPKVAVRTHGFLLDQHTALEHSLNFQPDDVVVSTLPIFVLSHFGSGVTSLIPDGDLRRPGAVQPLPIVKQIETHKATGLEASPAFLECFLRPDVSVHLPSMKNVFTGGAPVFPNLLDRFKKIAPNAELIAVYGSTEAEPIAEIPRSQMSEADIEAMQQGAGLLTGPPVEDINLKILPDRFGTPLESMTQAEFESQLLGSDEVGEIVVNGAHVLHGYLHGQGNEETKFKVDGQIWHRTGDAGYLDNQGRVWLLGRCSARIEDEHGTLYPFAVEAALSSNQSIRRSAFVSHRSKRVLAVEFRQADDALLETLKEQLAWAHLDHVLALDVPVDKRHNAKVDYPALNQLLDRALP
jgi:acyl-CoA synthetase (AMP-forming)/AMP-acid ligase II